MTLRKVLIITAAAISIGFLFKWTGNHLSVYKTTYSEWQLPPPESQNGEVKPIVVDAHGVDVFWNDTLTLSYPADKLKELNYKKELWFGKAETEKSVKEVPPLTGVNDFDVPEKETQ